MIGTSLTGQFPGVRKPQKIADPRFLWHADRLGLLTADRHPKIDPARIRGALTALRSDDRDLR